MKYRIKPVDPLISRDARQFGAGSPMYPIKWLSNTLIAGAVRTVIWKTAEDPYSYETLEALRKIAVKGAFPVIDKKMYFPRPLDIVRSAKDIYRIRPREIPESYGANMPVDGLIPSFPETEEDFKPEKLRAFWESDLMLEWLMNDNKFILNEELTLSVPLHDERVHACIDPETGTARDGNLFSTTGLDFIIRDNVNKTFSQESISIDIESGSFNLPERFTAALGGERRLAEFSLAEDDKSLWECPTQECISDKLRLVLATPAIFKNGWLPDWINHETLTGEIPDTNITVKLISAVTDRWQPVSGWSYERGKTGSKPMRRAVPAGSVYFFEILNGKLDIKSIWLKSICLDAQDINDGLGLVLAGKW